EAIEMVTIVVGVGATRGYRYTLIGAAGGLVVLAIAIAVGGIALAAIPIGPLRLVIGSLLLLFGLQWYRKGIVRVAARGFAGYHAQELQEEEDEGPPESGFDWTAWFLAFKGVTLEGLEIAIIVVSFGATSSAERRRSRSSAPRALRSRDRSSGSRAASCSWWSARCSRRSARSGPSRVSA